MTYRFTCAIALGGQPLLLGKAGKKHQRHTARPVVENLQLMGEGPQSPSSSMLSTVSLELTSLISSDSTWKKVSNDIWSTTRQATKVSILAAAACCNSLGGDMGNSEAGSGVEESFAHEGPPEVSISNESCSLFKGLSKDDTVSSEISTEGTGSCISTLPAEEPTASLGEDNSSPKGLVHENNKEGAYLRDNSGAVSQDLLNKDDRTVKMHEFSLQDDRSHWDLNTVMDAWECPFDYQYAGSQNNVADGIYEDAEDVMCSNKMRKSEGNDLQKEPGGTECDVERTLLPGISRGLSHETKELNEQETKLDEFSNIEGSICLQEKLLSSDIDNAPKMDLVEGIKSLHHQGRASSNIEPILSSPVEHTMGPSTSANGNENAPVQCTLGSMGSYKNLSSHQVASLNFRSDFSLSPKCGHLTSTCKSEGNCNVASSGVTSMKSIGDCTADIQIGETISPICQFENQEVAVPLVAFPEKASREIGDYLNENGENAEGISGFHDDQNIPKNAVGIGTDQSLGTGSLHHVIADAVCKPDDMGFPQSSRAFGGGQIAVAVDTYVQHAKVSLHDTAETDTRVHIDAEETRTESSGKSTALLGKPCGLSSHGDAQKRCSDYIVNGLDEVALEERFEDDYDSDVSLNDPGPVVGIEKTGELQVDYDSQYEDGELRESIEHTWEEYDGEDGEAEHVDYGSDNRDMYSFDGPDHHVSMSVQVEGAECKNQRYTDTNILGSEGELFVAQETNSQTCLGDLSTRKVIAAGSDKERTVKTSQPCTSVSGKDAINESDTSIKVGKEPGTVFDGVIRDNETHTRKDDVKYSGQSTNLKIRISGRDRLPECCKSSSDKTTGLGDGNGRTNSSGDCMFGLDAEDTETRVVGVRTFKRELQSRIEGPPNCDMFHRNDRLQGRRSTDVDYSNPRSERDSGSVTSLGRGRYSQRIHARGRGDDHFVDSFESHRGLTHHHSLHYHGPTDILHTGTENAAAAVSGKIENSGIVAASVDTIVKTDGAGSSDHAGRRTTYPSSQCAHRSFKRNGSSPVDRDEAFGMRLGIKSAGEMSPDRCATVGRARCVRYGPRFDDRGSRGGPVFYGCIKSSSSYLHHFSRRERSFSPIERRGDPHANQSHIKSPSRSRTRSPRGRNGTGVTGNPCLRHRSRSPSFRTEGRMRMRSPYQWPGFAADHMVGFMSMPRRHGSPLHNSRWIGDRKDGVIHFREQGYKQRSSVLDRRSPGRNFPRGDRFDFIDSPRKLKPNEYYRSMHPRRFSGMDGVGRGEPRHEGSDDDRRKHGYGYGPVHHLRRHEMDGAVKRFHYDIDDGFAVANNSRNRDATEFHGRGSPKDFNRDFTSHTGDGPRRSREERGPFIHRRDGKFNVNKSFGMWECDEDVVPRRRRPS